MTQILREILHMIITDTVINTLLGRLTLDPASMNCPGRCFCFQFILIFVHVGGCVHDKLETKTPSMPYRQDIVTRIYVAIREWS